MLQLIWESGNDDAAIILRKIQLCRPDPIEVLHHLVTGYSLTEVGNTTLSFARELYAFVGSGTYAFVGHGVKGRKDVDTTPCDFRVGRCRENDISESLFRSFITELRYI